MSRQAIRDAVVTTLTNAGVAGGDVRRGRANVLPDGGLPVAYVYTLREEVETLTLSGKRTREHRPLLVIDIWAKAAAGAIIEDTLDSAAAAAVAALTDKTLGGVCRDLLLTGIDYAYDGSEEAQQGCIRISYTAKYYSTEP